MMKTYKTQEINFSLEKIQFAWLKTIINKIKAQFTTKERRKFRYDKDVRDTINYNLINSRLYELVK